MRQRGNPVRNVEKKTHLFLFCGVVKHILEHKIPEQMHLRDPEGTSLLSYTVKLSAESIGQCLVGIIVSLYNICPKTKGIEPPLCHYLSHFKHPQ